MRFHFGLGAVSVLAACRPSEFGDPFKDYYDGSSDIEISGLDVTSEEGNVGGGTVTIQGSGFGDDPTLVTVQFGSTNATFLAVSASSLQVVVPRGPIQGGPVDVAVGTEDGAARLDDGYTFHVTDVSEEETGYVVVVNDWFSCYGGGNIDPALAGTGCGELGFIGITGTFGTAMFLNGTAFPNVHTIQVGFYQGSDISEGQWKRVPGDTYFPQEIDRLGRNVGPVSIKNPLLIGDDYCIDTANLATFQYTGGEVSDVDPKTGAIEYYEPLTYSTDITSLVEEAGTCEAPDARTYDLGTLQYCEIAYASDENNQHEYEADWPIDRPFFIGELAENGEYDASVAVDVQLDIPDEGIETLPIRLPEYAMFRGDLGFSGGSTPYWTLSRLESCFDSNGDGSATLDEDAITFSWVPSSVKSEDVVGGQVKAMQTYVSISISELRVGWFGGENFPARASVRVPDDSNYDEATGRSSFSIPNWVLYQFPTIDSSWGYQTPAGGGAGQSGTTDWAVASDNVGYFEIEAHRVTEYAIGTAKGDVVLAYATGDFGIFDWTNPIDAGECGDCIDTDGDGWVDDDDPDCDAGENEDGSAMGLYSCNDGIDNDGDGEVDSQDDDCGDGFDAESNCHDNEDNDDDGFTDEDDGECATPGLGQELGQDLPWWECSNGLDDDKDGWTDLDDPACTSGAAPEDDGFRKDLVCNNGIDDDGHGDIDASDPMCWKYGADGSTEVPSYAAGGACADGTDNDGDGYVDGNDPGCEFAPFSNEGDTDDDPDDHPTTKQCYDGLDNDNDGLTDALDPACWNDKGEPDGNLDDEASDAF